jgi:uncharacterized phage protein (TIGR02218 family)
VKTVSADLSLHLAQETTTLARLLKITRLDGTVLRLTDFDQDIPYNELSETAGPSLSVFSASGTNSGTASTQASATVTPGNATNFALFVTNNDPLPSGWTRADSGIYTLSPSGSSPISLTGLSSTGGSPDVQWANALATFTANGTPTSVQTGAWANDIGTGAHAVTLPLAVTQGNAIIVAISLNGWGAYAPLTVTDSLGNNYQQLSVGITNDNYTAGAMIFTAMDVLGGSTTITLTLPPSLSTVSAADVFEFSGLTNLLVIPSVPPYISSEGFTCSAVKHGSDSSPDNLTVTGFLESAGVNEHDVRAHLYDNATVELRAVNWADLTMGSMRLLGGTVGDIQLRNGAFEMELRGLTQLLSTQIGSTFSPLCRAELFGGGASAIPIDPQNHWKCRLNRDLWVQNGTVGSSPDSITIVPAAPLLMIGSTTPTLDAPAGWFDDGVITFTSGVLSGYSFEIASWDGTTMSLFGGAPMPFSPAPSDAYEIEPGCDKTIGICASKFGNAENHAGESAIPGLFQIGALSNSQVVG